MPIGSYALVPHIAHHLCTQQPRRVLDLGIGFGMYGAVVRQWLDAGVKPWRTHLVGVEVWADYRNPLWDLYDVVHVQTIEDFLTQQQRGVGRISNPSHGETRFDAVVLSDVIEHFDKGEGTLIIKSARELLAPDGWLLLGTPAVFMPQTAVWGNQHERHRSLWTRDDFAELGFTLLKDGAVDAFGHQMFLGKWQARLGDATIEVTRT
jgi:SAM-dependent methyltransferase